MSVTGSDPDVDTDEVLQTICVSETDCALYIHSDTTSVKRAEFNPLEEINVNVNVNVDL